MALIKCPNCKNSISEEAKKCPHCRKKVKKNKFILPVIIVIVLFITCIGAYYGWNQYQKIQEEKRQMQIDSLLIQVDEYYAVFDFEEIEKCYAALDELYYDTSKQREILEYDRSVYEDAYSYFVTINEIDDKLHNGGYSSLRALINKIKMPTKNFEELKINTDSEIGKYINNVRNNIMYNTFNAEYVNTMKYDLDSGLTSWGFAYIIETYTEEIAKIDFPYIQ